MMTKSKVREYWKRYVFNVGCHGIRQLNDVYGKHGLVKAFTANELEMRIHYEGSNL